MVSVSPFLKRKFLVSAVKVTYPRFPKSETAAKFAVKAITAANRANIFGDRKPNTAAAFEVSRGISAFVITCSVKITSPQSSRAVCWLKKLPKMKGSPFTANAARVIPKIDLG